MRGRVYADFRREEDYFPSLFTLALTLLGAPFEDPEISELLAGLQQAG